MTRHSWQKPPKRYKNRISNVQIASQLENLTRGCLEESVKNLQDELESLKQTQAELEQELEEQEVDSQIILLQVLCQTCVETTEITGAIS